MIAQLIRGRGRTGFGLVTFGLPILILIVLSIVSPSFLRLGNIANINSQITALLIVSLGQLLVVLSAGIDLSVGSVVSLTSGILVTADPALAVPLALLAGLAVGLVNGFGVTIFRVHPLVMTLATMTLLQGVALLVHPVPGGQVPAFLEPVAKFSIGGLPAAFFWCLAALGLTAFLLNRTRFGLRIFAIGANAESAALNGVRIVAPKVACYVLCSLAGVLAGIFLTSRVSSGDPTIGAPFSLESVTAVALGGALLSGGVGSVPGVLFGTLTLGLMANGMNLLGISPFIRAAVTGVLLLLAVSLQRRKVIGV